MKGLRIDPPNAHRFKEVFGSVLDDLDRYYWLIDTQSGPFSITDKPNFRELDAEIDRYEVAAAELDDISTGLWRPGIFRFADLLVVDEFTYLVGIAGSEEDAIAITPSISDALGITPAFFGLLEKRADCALLHIDGWWEVYSTNSLLMDRISKIQGASPTDSDVLCRQLYQGLECYMPHVISPEAKQLIDRPNFAHLATLMSDGSPQSVPVWIGREGEQLIICTGEGSLKATNTRRDPRVALSIVDFHNPYEEVQIRGRVVERRSDSDFKYMDLISHKYTGKPFPFRSPEGRVALFIAVEKERYTKLPFEHTPPR